jgi:ABC-type Na+ efflux pump permease subunit
MRNPMMASDLDISSMVVGSTISTIGVVSVFTLPLLTMRLWAEEKRSGTVELLLTFPLRDSSIVLGKFFAGLAVYVVMLLLSLLYPLLAGLYAQLDPGPILAIWARSSSGPRCLPSVFSVRPGPRTRLSPALLPGLAFSFSGLLAMRRILPGRISASF